MQTLPPAKEFAQLKLKLQRKSESLKLAEEENAALEEQLHALKEENETLRDRAALVSKLESLVTWLNTQNTRLTADTNKSSAELQLFTTKRKELEEAIESCRDSQTGLRQDLGTAELELERCAKGQKAALAEKDKSIVQRDRIIKQLTKQLESSKAETTEYKDKWRHAVDVAENAREAYQQEFNKTSPY